MRVNYKEQIKPKKPELEINVIMNLQFTLTAFKLPEFGVHWQMFIFKYQLDINEEHSSSP